ncbi:MAG: MmcQ/YjbR family DNA-binding protein [Wolinella sp.]
MERVKRGENTGILAQAEVQLAKMPGAILSFPFGKDIATYKIEGKIFALLWRDESARLNLKAHPHDCCAYREIYPFITPAYHMNKRHWNSISLNDVLVCEALLKEMIEESYQLVFSALSRAKREKILARG